MYDKQQAGRASLSGSPACSIGVGLPGYRSGDPRRLLVPTDQILTSIGWWFLVQTEQILISIR